MLLIPRPRKEEPAQEVLNKESGVPPEQFLLVVAGETKKIRLLVGEHVKKLGQRVKVRSQQRLGQALPRAVQRKQVFGEIRANLLGEKVHPSPSSADMKPQGDWT